MQSPSGGSGRGKKNTPGPRSGKTGADKGGKSGAGQAGQGGSKQGKKTGGKPGQPSKAFARERYGRQLGALKAPGKKPKGASLRETKQANPGGDSEGVRLQKVMANAGVASRRVCEELIAEGRVEVNGEPVTELGMRVDPTRDTIHVDGMRVQLNETLKYYVFNKPRGVVSTMEDPEGRKCISDFVKNKNERLFHVGRLDVNTEGLLVLTNDGELANRLTHPSYEVPKKYLVQVAGPLPHGVGAEMKKGVRLEDGFANVDSFKLVDSAPGKVLIEVVLHSGRNRVVRRLFDAVGYPVKRLVRLEMGPLRLGDQKQGVVRQLGPQEVGHLLASVDM
ncbi:pseudouridine synthase [Kocuria polaris]|nr:pseudouridine synthase [Kocuria polaris]